MLKEVCVENFTNIPRVIADGAQRIELCDNLVEGGTTVSRGVMEAAVNYGRKKGVPTMCIIRPRGGNFVYDETERQIMERDIDAVKEAGAAGVVIGALKENGWLDEKLLKQLIQKAEGLSVTFHMAFDYIPEDLQLQAIDWLVEHHVDRILTHGGKGGTKIEDNVDNLQRLIHYAGDRIVVMPGGGITGQNVMELYEKLQFSEVHGTKIVD